MNPLWLIIPIGVGLAQPAIMQMCVRVSRATGDMESAVILHIVGTLVGLGWMGVGLREGGFSGMGNAPWWAFLGGVIGVSCMAAMTRTIPVVGVATFCALAVASQLIMALLFDRHGIMGAEIRDITFSHWLGAAMLALGAFLVSR
jgi:transporter family-2 protein